MSFDNMRSLFNDIGTEIENIFNAHEHHIRALRVELENEKDRNKKLKQLLYNFLEDDLNE